MQEQILFDRVHGALDVEPPPGAYERLERRLAAASVTPRREIRLGGIRFTGGLKLVSAIVAVLLVLAAAGAFIGVRLISPGPSPARHQLSVSAYQALIQRDWSGWSSAGDSSACANLQSVCPAPGAPARSATQKWLKDLQQSEPPARFAIIDSLLRRHLAAEINDLSTLFAAYAARDESGLTRAYFAASTEGTWVDDVANTIVRSREVTAATYVTDIETEKANLAACATCASLTTTTPLSCSAPAATCEFDVYDALGVIEVFEATLIRSAAPAGLATPDALLQGDLAVADSALEAMAAAYLAGDQAGFDAGRASFATALPRVNADITRILTT